MQKNSSFVYVSVETNLTPLSLPKKFFRGEGRRHLLVRPCALFRVILFCNIADLLSRQLIVDCSGYIVSVLSSKSV